MLGERCRGGACVYCFYITLLFLRSYVSLSALMVYNSMTEVPGRERLTFTFEYPAVHNVGRGTVPQCREWFRICVLKSDSSGLSVQQVL